MRRPGLSLVAASLLGALLPGTLSAGLVTVYTPGVYTNSSASAYNDPLAANTWLRRNVNPNSSIGISGDYARSGNGSIYMDGLNGSSKGDLEYYFGDLTGKTLGNLSALGYDWYRDVVSNNPSAQAPVIRLYMDADGDMTTTSDRGYLIYEPTYNGVASAPEGAWQTADAYNGGNGNFWLRQFSPGQSNNVFNRDINDWRAGQTTSGFLAFSNSSIVYGLNVGFGSGWNGHFTGAVDNITVGFGGSSTTYNFEVVPEPSTAVAGCLAIAMSLTYAWGRRKKLAA